MTVKEKGSLVPRVRISVAPTWKERTRAIVQPRVFDCVRSPSSVRAESDSTALHVLAQLRYLYPSTAAVVRHRTGPFVTESDPQRAAADETLERLHAASRWSPPAGAAAVEAKVADSIQRLVDSKQRDRRRLDSASASACARQVAPATDRATERVPAFRLAAEYRDDGVSRRRTAAARFDQSIPPSSLGRAFPFGVPVRLSPARSFAFRRRNTRTVYPSALSGKGSGRAYHSRGGRPYSTRQDAVPSRVPTAGSQTGSE